MDNYEYFDKRRLNSAKRLVVGLNKANAARVEYIYIFIPW